MTAPVDVLAVIDAEISRYETSAEIDRLTGSDSASADVMNRSQPLREARAAVAELIAAAKDIRENGLGTASGKRLESALARAGGEK